MLIFFLLLYFYPTTSSLFLILIFVHKKHYRISIIFSCCAWVKSTLFHFRNDFLMLYLSSTFYVNRKSSVKEWEEAWFKRKQKWSGLWFSDILSCDCPPGKGACASLCLFCSQHLCLFWIFSSWWYLKILMILSHLKTSTYTYYWYDRQGYLYLRHKDYITSELLTWEMMEALNILEVENQPW